VYGQTKETAKSVGTASLAVEQLFKQGKYAEAEKLALKTLKRAETVLTKQRTPHDTCQH
jgi:hypothetical protein